MWYTRRFVGAKYSTKTLVKKLEILAHPSIMAQFLFYFPMRPST